LTDPQRPPTPFADALKELDELPRDQVEIGGAAKEGGEAGIFIEGQRDIGKPGGWALVGSAEWWKQAGWALLGKLRWTPKP
jgi:hypothetical protein